MDELRRDITLVVIVDILHRVENRHLLAQVILFILDRLALSSLKNLVITEHQVLNTKCHHRLHSVNHMNNISEGRWLSYFMWLPNSCGRIGNRMDGRKCQRFLQENHPTQTVWYRRNSFCISKLLYTFLHRTHKFHTQAILRFLTISRSQPTLKS